jgi:tRNA-2-methylthio-N6-dimethylallyladenosine synthase
MSILKLHIKSFGCQMNKLDTVLVTSALKEAGFALTDSVADADVVLINTCSVRGHAEDRVISNLGRLKHIKKSKPQLIVAVIGCMAQRLGEQLLKHPAVDIVCGPAQLPQIAELIMQTIHEKKKTLAVTEKIRQKVTAEQSQALGQFESIYDTEEQHLSGQAFVRAMHGCNNFCSYCVVPYVRGPEVSRPPQIIIEQIKRLAGRGIKLITLLGQTINSYKYVNGEKTYCLADLLEMASDIDGIEWIRFVTSYPSEEFFEQICRSMADLPKVCKYLHIPAQSGSDKILLAMNRHYTSAQYLNLLDRARDIAPGISIAGDFIVGFSGETEQDFAATVDLVKKARYKNCFIFKYSPRPGTDNIPTDVKKQRNIELLAVQEKISAELSTEFLGKTAKVLVEGLSKKPHLNTADGNKSPQLIARTADDWIVVFNGPTDLTSQFADVKITKTSALTLFGEISK